MRSLKTFHQVISNDRFHRHVPWLNGEYLQTAISWYWVNVHLLLILLAYFFFVSLSPFLIHLLLFFPLSCFFLILFLVFLLCSLSLIVLSLCSFSFYISRSIYWPIYPIFFFLSPCLSKFSLLILFALNQFVSDVVDGIPPFLRLSFLSLMIPLYLLSLLFSFSLSFSLASLFLSHPYPPLYPDLPLSPYDLHNRLLFSPFA